jgi:8-amino-7-oxononanoate synthase
MNTVEDHLKKKLDQRKEENALRELRIASGENIDFFTNDYLGFAKDSADWNPQDFKWGSTGSRLLGGNDASHEELENFLAEFHQSPSALLFNSGYSANTGLFSCIAKRGDTFIYDEYVHASIRDGIRLSLANSWSFLHNDLDYLEKKLISAKGNIFVIVESVYSMDGDFAPLKELISICEKYGASLIVDEAHANGIFGKNGEGKVAQENLQEKVFARILTFGKALGSHGAVVLGSENLKDYLINFSRPFIYTTALPPVAANHIRHQYERLMTESACRQNLFSLIGYFNSRKEELGNLIEVSPRSDSAIQTIIIPGNEKVRMLSKKLLENKLDVRPILSPTVPEGKERLRICLHSFNSEKEVDLLLDSVSNFI